MGHKLVSIVGHGHFKNVFVRVTEDVRSLSRIHKFWAVEGSWKYDNYSLFLSLYITYYLASQIILLWNSFLR